ncbi:CLUMA_CG021319, isoform A [Clunio marinus]|uniref:CLUMA_CG021319, isoform A n=1 Tax=Clunio marinus TaxID=568069 RepID=A0A1J1J8B4_9DIPT|nr:CLUMA_CG021319, isoform A [Clunio marinus]
MNQSSDLQEIHILNLPDEIFLHIFSYVNVASCKNVFEVCRRFYELMSVVRRGCPLELTYSQSVKVINPDENISKLNLYKLKKLTIMNGSNCLNILNRIPKDTLKEAIISFRDVDKGLQQFFNQQTNIKMLKIDEKNQVNFDHLKLEHLEINKEFFNSKFMNIPSILRVQPRLRYIDFTDYLIEDEIFKAICELRNLEVAKMRVNLEMPCHVFESLKNLTQLKELQIKSDKIHQCNHLLELSRMHLKIEKLTLLYKEEKFLPEFCIQLSHNFRNLKQIRIVNRSFFIINTILENFPNLESIVLDCYHWSTEENVLVVRENLRHEKLKEIVVTSVYDDSAVTTRSLLTLLNACPNLERIMLSQLVEVYYEDLQQIINDHPKLTHLSLHFNIFDFEDGIIDLIRTAASRLQFIELEGLFSSADFQTESSLKDLFEDEFTYISYSDYGYDDFIYDGTLTMKKRNVSKWYRDLNM